ncbi:PQQ-binding-like beta-propeller repeat protein [Gemmata sp. G18]|uniref:PQQ-binding-like beta-propeller repeat protein n=1 Tax=Gemmata palustris TaxID=2822762 RepID=A0ABS5C052_9BACT|nr:PQQ-binding-like beta-propeller repeat protein [Gemmata palustris]MBP3959361.1 PQQ-binding-like beta-propeller repeat protein [Gemmata palustris]
MSRTCLLSLLASTFALALGQAGDWPRFRGPNGSGTVAGTLPDIDPAHPLWAVKVPGGKGVSSPIIVDGKVYLQSASADGKARSLMCLNAADGKTLWTKELPGNKASAHAKNSLASGTPACDGTQIYCAWWDGSAVSLAAYDLTGKEAWQASLGSYVSQHGPGFSPMVHNGLVFVNVDDDKHAELVAFDAKTGQKKWFAERKHVRASYTTPFLLERPGKPAELILGTTTAITSYQPATGKVNWEYTMVWAKGDMPLRVIGHPVYVNGLLVVYCGDGGGSRYMAAIDIDGKKPTKVWDLKKDTPYVPCLLVKDNRLFWIGDKGVAACAEAKTGKAAWAERVFTGDVTASPILVGDKILMVSEKGEVAVVKADKEYEEPAKVSLDEGVYASPAIADGRVYIRGVNTLFCFGKK